VIARFYDVNGNFASSNQSQAVTLARAGTSVTVASGAALAGSPTTLTATIGHVPGYSANYAGQVQFFVDGSATPACEPWFTGPGTTATCTVTFTTAAAAGNADFIADFLGGTDKIALDDAVFQGIGTPGSFTAANFVAGTAAADANDRIIYNAANGQLLYDADGNGAGAAVLVATLQGNPVLAASDFAVI
jgi:hypothetical protein